MKSRQLANRGRVIAIAAGVLSILIALPNYSSAQVIKRTLDDLDDWQVTEEPVIGTPEYELYLVRKLLAEDRFSQAKSKADDWIEKHPNHAATADAYLIRGQARQSAKEYYKALFDYEFVARTYPGSEAFIHALEHEMEIAHIFASGTKRKMWGFRMAGAKDEAEELYIRIQERVPGSKLAEEAGRALADYYYRERDMSMAATAYDLYIDNYPTATDRVEAMQQLVYSHIAKHKGPRFDPSGLYEADAWLEMIERGHPADAEQMGAEALKARIRESDAARMLEDARWYAKRADDVSTRFLLKRLLRRYPTTVAGQTAYRVLVNRGWIDQQEAGEVVEEVIETGNDPIADELGPDQIEIDNVDPEIDPEDASEPHGSTD